MYGGAHLPESQQEIFPPHSTRRITQNSAVLKKKVGLKNNNKK